MFCDEWHVQILHASYKLDDFEEKIEANYLLLKFCMKYYLVKNILRLTHFP